MCELRQITITDIFKDLCRHLLNDQCTKSLSQRFMALNTNRNRVLLVYENIKKYNLFPKLKKENKNNIRSAELRQCGNKEFASKKDLNALNYYNRSIAYAETNTECIALAYANRSAVLFQMGYYKECLRDVEQALNENYPEQLKKKVIQRYEKAKNLLDQSKTFKYYNEISMPTSDLHSTIKCATNAVDINYTPELGRHLIASKNIAPGDIIAIEEPFIVVLLADYFYSHCHFCLTRTLNPIHCQYCPNVMFCSLECRELSYEQYHRYECPLMSTLLSLNIGRMGGLALRTAIKARNTFKQLIDGNYVLNEYVYEDENKKKYDSKYYNAIHNLIANTEQRDVNDLFIKAVKAAIILYLLENFTDFLSDDLEIFKNEMTIVLAELLMLHLQTAPSNMHQISEHQLNKTGKGFESIEIGAGAYAFLSLLNHSCAPNVVRRSHGTNIVLRALRPIKIGQQLLDNYGFHHAIMSKRERKEGLKNQYYFDCNCEACTDNWPLYHNLISKEQSVNHFLSDVISLLYDNNLTEAKIFLPRILQNALTLDATSPSKELADVHEVIKEYYGLEGNKFPGF